MNSTARTPEAGACPSDEWLVAFLIGEQPSLAEPGAARVSLPQHDAIAAHVRDCDRCVAELRIVRDRMRLAFEVDAPVPAAVLARATPPVAPTRHAASHELPWWRGLVERFRLPLLVPVAAAAALVIAVGLPQRRQAPVPEELTRAVAMRQPARVTAPQATLYAAPQSDSLTVARLERGADVFLLAEQKEWYRIERPDGETGWMEKSAFE